MTDPRRSYVSSCKVVVLSVYLEVPTGRAWSARGNYIHRGIDSNLFWLDNSAVEVVTVSVDRGVWSVDDHRYQRTPAYEHPEKIKLLQFFFS